MPNTHNPADNSISPSGSACRCPVDRPCPCACHTHRRDWTCDINGVSNSSPAYLELVDVVDRIIRTSGHDLLQGHADWVARSIVSTLAHKHQLAPQRAPEASPSSEAARHAQQRHKVMDTLVREQLQMSATFADHPHSGALRQQAELATWILGELDYAAAARLHRCG